ncbi:acid-sensing ion channel 3-like [Rhinoraja longicauda]
MEMEGRKSPNLVDFAESSTLHGLSHIFTSGGLSLRRLLWLLAFLLSLGTFLYQVADRVEYYTQYHHVTTLDEVDSASMAFPAVTFCNQNSFRKSRISRNDLYWVGSLLGVKQSDYPAFLRSLGQDGSMDGFFPSRTYDMTELYQRTGHELTEMLLDCRYRSEECTAEDFSIIFTRYGKCYTFNSGQEGFPLLTTMKGGTGNGLEVMLDIQQDEYLPVWGKTGVFQAPVPCSLLGLAGDIGGQMGLFIGASILTILEIFDYIYEVLKDKIARRRNRSKRSHSDNLSTCDTLRSHSDSLGFTPNMLPRHPTLGTFEEFAC